MKFVDCFAEFQCLEAVLIIDFLPKILPSNSQGMKFEGMCDDIRLDIKDAQ